MEVKYFMLYKMNTKTFMKIFAHEDPKLIEKTQFLTVSKRIRKTSEEPNVIFLPKLFPSDMLLADHRCTFNEGYFEEMYKKELKKNKLFLAIIIKGIIEEKYTTVLLCTYKEWQIGYMQVLADYIMETFGYPVIDYKKFKKHKKVPKELRDLDERAIIDRCNEIIEHEERKRKKELMKTPKGRLKILESMNKEDMIHQLKKMNLYTKGMDKATMKEFLMDFFVNG